jgi:hypothetical protein
VLETNAKGRQTPRKVGMEPIQRAGAEYEYSIVFELDMAHNALVSKNRTRLFEDEKGLPVAINLADPGVAQQIHTWLTTGAALVEKEWKAPSEKRAPSGSGQQAPVEASKRADASVFLSAEDRQRFWVDAKKHKLGPEYTESQLSEDLRIWMFDTFGITTTTQMPLSRVNEARIWAQSPPEKRILAVGERKARDAANILSMNEAELRAELQVANGEWEEVVSSLGSKIDAAAER